MPGEAQRTPTTRCPAGRMAYVRDKWVGENLAFGTVCRVGRFPSMAPKVAKLACVDGNGAQFVDRSDGSSAVRAGCARRDGIRHSGRAPARGVRRVRDLTRCRPPCCSPIEVRVRRPTTSRSPPGLDGRRGGSPSTSTRHAVRGVLRRSRADHGRLRRSAALGQAARAASHAEGRYPQWDVFADTPRAAGPDRTFANPYSTASWGERAKRAQPTCSIWVPFFADPCQMAPRSAGGRWRPDTLYTEHPLRRILERAAGESFPPADGGYDVLPPDAAGTQRGGRVLGARLRVG